MALVKILANNIFAGASLKKLEVGAVYDVDDATAEQWIAKGRAELSKEKTGEKLITAASSSAVTVSDDVTALQAQLVEARAKVDTLTQAAEVQAAALAAETQRADEAVAALAAAGTKDK